MLDWLSDNHDAIEVIVWIFGLLGLVVAVRQLIEGRRQRSISETFDLVAQLDGALDRWSVIANDEKASRISKRKRLGDLLSLFELICDAINRGMLTSMSRAVLANQVIDSAKIVYSFPGSTDDHAYLCEDPRVCGAVKIFLINNWKRLQPEESYGNVKLAFLGSASPRLLRAGIIPFLQRQIRVAQMTIQGR